MTTADRTDDAPCCSCGARPTPRWPTAPWGRDGDTVAYCAKCEPFVSPAELAAMRAAEAPHRARVRGYGGPTAEDIQRRWAWPVTPGSSDDDDEGHEPIVERRVEMAAPPAPELSAAVEKWNARTSLRSGIAIVGSHYGFRDRECISCDRPMAEVTGECDGLTADEQQRWRKWWARTERAPLTTAEHSTETLGAYLTRTGQDERRQRQLARLDPPPDEGRTP